MNDSYELLVGAEHCGEIMSDLAGALAPHLLQIPEDHIGAIIAASLVSLAQILDGNKLPQEWDVVKQDGISHKMRLILNAKAPA